MQMPMAEWPVGYFRSYSGWLLRHRRTVPARVSTLNAEIQRIGFIKVDYRTVNTTDGDIKSEDKMGFSVTAGSSLEKLLQAYIANGGNPLSISGFMHPQSTSIDVDGNGEGTKSEQYPNSGVVFPLSGDPNDPLSSDTDTGYGASQAGMLDTYRYYPARQGTRLSPGAYDHGSVVKSMHHMRAWANQDIKEMNDMESRIIKLCDLREQLIQERDVILVQAFGGVLPGVQDLKNDQFDSNLLVQNIYQDMANLVFKAAPSGVTLLPTHKDDEFLPFTFPAVPAEFSDWV
jgi:hypothetical protein